MCRVFGHETCWRGVALGCDAKPSPAHADGPAGTPDPATCLNGGFQCQKGRMALGWVAGTSRLGHHVLTSAAKSTAVSLAPPRLAL